MKLSTTALSYLIISSSTLATNLPQSCPASATSSCASHAISTFKLALSSDLDDTSPSTATKEIIAHFNSLPFASSNVPHTGNEPFSSHLLGVFEVLNGWSAPPHLLHAGLYHSVYGTEGFDPGKEMAVSFSSRDKIQQIIGTPAEALVFAFCVIDRNSFDELLLSYYDPKTKKPKKRKHYAMKSRIELGGFKIQMSQNEFLDFVTLCLADWLEQVEGAALRSSDTGYGWKVGEAWSYRRRAYESMSNILIRERGLGIAKSTYRAVYGVEGEGSKKLEQRRTPPLTEGAKMAYEVWMSSLGADEREKILSEFAVVEVVDEEEE